MVEVIWSPALVFYAGSGLVMLALGLAVAWLKPRRVVTVSFGAFSIAFGVAFVVSNIGFRMTPADLGSLLVLGSVVPFAVASVALVVVSLQAPRPVSGRDRQAIVIAGAVASFMAIAHASILLGNGTVARAAVSQISEVTLPDDVGLFFAISIFPMYDALVFALLLMALRYPSFAGDDRGCRQVALMSAGIVIYTGFVAGSGVLGAPTSALSAPGAARLLGVVGLAGVLLAAALWMVNTAKGPLPRTARNVSLLFLAATTLGILYAAFAPQFPGAGIARILGACVLGYAIVRHQLLGIDVKMRWTLSKTTVAGVFIAVFFVVSEGAQEFFGETIGSTYLGILAAGMLVFAIAPLSRVADRLAEKAVPIAGTSTAGRDGREEAFRAALRLALRGEITRSEEFELARIAEAYGISHVRALELRGEVEGTTSKHRGRAP